MYRPSGDQRGLNRPDDPGSTFTSFVFRSSILTSEELAASGRREKTICVPSGDQAGSPSAVSCGSNSSGVPPCAETTKVFQGFPSCADINVIFVPSGDQRGRADDVGAYVSCSFPVPSTRLTHSV